MHDDCLVTREIDLLTVFIPVYNFRQGVGIWKGMF